jgi:hypothetical protein
LPGESAPKPFEAKPPVSKPGLPLAMMNRMAAPAMAPRSWATM